MKHLLKEVLEALDSISEEYDEIFDTDCREQMAEAIFCGFVKPATDFSLPDEFGMFTDDGNAAVKNAIAQFIEKGNALAIEKRINSFHDRLAAVQDGEVESDAGNTFDEYFGWTDPNDYDAQGNSI